MKKKKKKTPTAPLPKANLNLPSDVDGNYLGIRSIHPGVGETSGGDQGLYKARLQVSTSDLSTHLEAGKVCKFRHLKSKIIFFPSLGKDCAGSYINVLCVLIGSSILVTALIHLFLGVGLVIFFFYTEIVGCVLNRRVYWKTRFYMNKQ